MALYIVEHVNRKIHEIHAETFSDFEDALRDFRHKNDVDNEESYLYFPEEPYSDLLALLRSRADAYNSGCITEDGFKYKCTIQENHATS